MPKDKGCALGRIRFVVGSSVLLYIFIHTQCEVTRGVLIIILIRGSSLAKKP